MPAQTPDAKDDVPPKPASKDQKVDEAMEETFPASDPPAHTGVTGPSGDMQAR